MGKPKVKSTSTSKNVPQSLPSTSQPVNVPSQLPIPPVNSWWVMVLKLLNFPLKSSLWLPLVIFSELIAVANINIFFALFIAVLTYFISGYSLSDCFSMSISLLNADLNNIKDMSFSLFNIQDTLTNTVDMVENTVVNTIDVATDRVQNTLHTINLIDTHSVVMKVVETLCYLQFLIISYGTMVVYLHGSDLYNQFNVLLNMQDFLALVGFHLTFCWQFIFKPFLELISLPTNLPKFFDLTLVKTVKDFFVAMFNDGKDIYLNLVTTTKVDHINESLNIIFQAKNEATYFREVDINDNASDISDQTVKAERLKVYKDFHLNLPQHVINNLKENNTDLTFTQDVVNNLKYSNSYNTFFKNYLEYNSLTLTNDEIINNYFISSEYIGPKDISVKIPLSERLSAAISHYGFWLATSSTMLSFAIALSTKLIVSAIF